jgi:hypothetical protein
MSVKCRVDLLQKEPCREAMADDDDDKLPPCASVVSGRVDYCFSISAEILR